MIIISVAGRCLSGSREAASTRQCPRTARGRLHSTAFIHAPGSVFAVQIDKIRIGQR